MFDGDHRRHVSGGYGGGVIIFAKMNPYMNFVKRNRDRVVQDNPGMTFTEIGRELGRMWRGLTDEEKESYRCCEYDHEEESSEYEYDSE